MSLIGWWQHGIFLERRWWGGRVWKEDWMWHTGILYPTLPFKFLHLSTDALNRKHKMTPSAVFCYLLGRHSSDYAPVVTGLCGLGFPAPQHKAKKNAELQYSTSRSRGLPQGRLQVERQMENGILPLHLLTAHLWAALQAFISSSTQEVPPPHGGRENAMTMCVPSSRHRAHDG